MVPSQASPPRAACFRIRRSRYFWPSTPQGLQEPQGSSSQSTEARAPHSAGQEWQWCSSLTEPSHGQPPPWACWATSRVRTRQPMPQVRLQAPHAPHGPRWQCCGCLSLQPAVCRRMPRQALPPFSGFCRMILVRNFCSESSVHEVQCSHWESMQSFEKSHGAAGQLLVSRSGPSQGVPHSLFISMMTRFRSQRPWQEGSDHSLQVPKLHSMGLHVVQALVNGHRLWLSCVPEHLVSLVPMKR
mmetsp:Transcript_12503/g.36411  ORF Transcript_12503/g.36411 Transcript_12503/m.36411 type:complete len:243 (-) Transcript_12503:374-1102(-)